MKSRPTWSPLGIFKVVLGLFATVLFAWLIFKNVSRDDIYKAFARTDWSGLWLMVVVIAAGVLARAVRWWLLLRARDPDVPLSGAIRPFLIAMGVNNLLPFRAGDFSRLFSLRNAKLPPAYVAGTMVVERVFDLLALSLIFYFTLMFAKIEIPEAFLKSAQWATGLMGAGIIVVAAFARYEEALLRKIRSLGFVSRSRLLLMVLDRAAEVLGAISGIRSAKRLASLLALSLIGWLFEGTFFSLAVSATGAHGGVPAGLIALCVATLSTALPSAPGYVGTFHYFAAQAVMAFGTTQAVAVLYALVTHSLIWIVTTAPLLALFPQQFFSRKKV